MPDWSWTWHAHPEAWAFLGIIVAGYAYALKRLGPRLAGHEPVSTRAHRRNFALAVLTLLVAAEWPVHDLSEGYLYSVHMTQHMLLTLVAAPLLLAAVPPWLVRAVLPGRAMLVARALCRPLMALAIFNIVLVFTHWPKIVETTTVNEPLHFALHALIVVSALIMWMPVLSPVLELPRLSYPGQMFYLFLQSLVPTVPASFLTFGERPLYHIYTLYPKLWGLSALEDQRAAGLVMKLGGGTILWIVITVLFFKWYEYERSGGIDALANRDLDRSLNRMELTK